MTKGATVIQVIQEGRDLVDQMDRGRTRKGMSVSYSFKILTVLFLFKVSVHSTQIIY